MVQDDESIDLVGVFQDVYVKEEDKQVGTVASGMLQGVEKSIDISVIGDIRCVTGKNIKWEELDNGIKVISYIISDVHMWSEGVYKSALNIFIIFNI